MEQILKDIISKGEECNTCVLLTNGEWYCGVVSNLCEKEHLVWFRSQQQEESNRHWTTVIRIQDITSIEFRSDVRSLNSIEKSKVN